jgi:hypothetical protein
LRNLAHIGKRLKDISMRDLLGNNWFQEKINWVRIDFRIKETGPE